MSSQGLIVFSNNWTVFMPNTVKKHNAQLHSDLRSNRSDQHSNCLISYFSWTKREKRLMSCLKQS